ncbi:hypothetical protein Q5752_001620 [Cryptotrichosporon argae]
MRTKGAKTARKTTKVATGKPTKNAQSASSAADLIDKAHTLLAQSNFELAIKFLERLLELEPENGEARELVGIAELEGGDADRGRQHLLLLLPPHATSPTHPSPYLYLAQVAEDPHEALGYYSTAAAMIEQRASSGQGSDEEKEMAVSALVAMVEIWMSDLCFEPSASDNCDALIARALALSPASAEARLSLASIRISQSKFDEARQIAVGLYKEVDDPDSPLPSLPTRLLLVRLLLEHSLHAEALDVVGTVRDEDALELEGAYLEGWAWWLRAEALGTGASAEAVAGKPDVDEEPTVAECLSESMRALLECARLFGEQDHPDLGVGTHTEELLRALKEKGVEPAADEGGDEEDCQAEGDVSGWEDVDDDVKMD